MSAAHGRRPASVEPQGEERRFDTPLKIEAYYFTTAAEQDVVEAEVRSFLPTTPTIRP